MLSLIITWKIFSLQVCGFWRFVRIAVVYSLLQEKSNTKLPKRQSCRGASSVERRPTIKSWQYVMGIKMHHPEIQNAESFLNDNPLFWAKVSKDKVSSKAPNIENRRDHNENIRYLQKSEKFGPNCKLKYRIFESSNPIHQVVKWICKSIYLNI